MKTIFLFIADTRINIIDIVGPIIAVKLLAAEYVVAAAITFGVGIIVSAVAETVAREIRS